MPNPEDLPVNIHNPSGKDFPANINVGTKLPSTHFEQIITSLERRMKQGSLPLSPTGLPTSNSVTKLVLEIIHPERYSEVTPTAPAENEILRELTPHEIEFITTMRDTVSVSSHGTGNITREREKAVLESVSMNIRRFNQELRQRLKH